MIASVYNRRSLGYSSSIPSLSPIDVRFESEIQSSLKTSDCTTNDYFVNKYGDDYSCCDALGFERSYMGSRADFNHII